MNSTLIIIGIAATIFAVFFIMAFRSMRTKPEEEDRFNISKKAKRPAKKKKSTVAEDDALLDRVTQSTQKRQTHPCLLYTSPSPRDS